eukprot:Hpha_TRINITY_DN15664_c4_g2::TRINITY_DN15664_c4_g2_i1::g.101961::m.101961
MVAHSMMEKQVDNQGKNHIQLHSKKQGMVAHSMMEKQVDGVTAEKREDVLGYVAAWIGVVAEANRELKNATVPKPMSDFKCVSEPAISVKDFVLSLRGCACDVEWVVALILIDRLLQKTTPAHFTPLNGHRLITTALVISIKLHRDVSTVAMTLSHFAGLELRDVVKMEATFLSLLGWETFVNVSHLSVVTRALPYLKRFASGSANGQVLIPIAALPAPPASALGPTLRRRPSKARKLQGPLGRILEAVTKSREIAAPE